MCPAEPVCNKRSKCETQLKRAINFKVENTDNYDDTPIIFKQLLKMWDTVRDLPEVANDNKLKKAFRELIGDKLDSLGLALTDQHLDDCLEVYREYKERGAWDNLVDVCQRRLRGEKNG